MNKQKIIYGQIALILIVIYPVLSLFLNNINEVRFTEILLPVFINIIISEIIFVIIYVLTRQYIASIAYSVVLFYIGMNFKEYFYKLIDTVYYWNAVPIVLYVTIVILMIINYTKLRLILDKLLLFATIGVVCAAGLTLFNNADILMKQSTMHDNTTTNKIDNVTNVIDKRADLPNIYYIILDEYSSFKQMKKWYDYDNKEFYDFLKKYNFNIISNSQNESMNTLTMYITTNLININYVSTDNDFMATTQLRNNPYLFQLLEQHGYQVRYKGGPQIGWKDSQIKLSSTTIEGETLNDIIYGKNILYPLFEKNQNIIQKQEEDLYDYFTEYIQNISDSSFLYIHFRAGHVPLVFNVDSINNSNQFFNMKDKSLYLGQIKYTTTRIMQILSKIIEKDPDSIIIIQSDHSQRNLEDENGNKIIPVKDSQQVFNAVYYKGETLNFDNTLSGVNTVRLVLDKILNTNLGVIDVP